MNTTVITNFTFVTISNVAITQLLLVSSLLV